MTNGNVPFKISWEEISPEKANAWLNTCNVGNRTLRETTVISFAMDMKRGAWSPSHQGIAFDVNGNLIDGQHRLAAIAMSEKSQWLLVFRNVPERIDESKTKVADAIDRGNARSVSDVLRLRHGYKVNAAMIAASCVTIAQLATRSFGNDMRRLSIANVLDVIERYKKGLAFVSENRPTNIGLRVTPVCGAVAFAHATAPRKSEEFYTKFSVGAGIDAESPILTLRNYLQSDIGSTRGSSRKRLRIAERTLHAIYCFIEGKPMPIVPRDKLLVGADWFRAKQPENVKFLQSLFPVLEHKFKKTAGTAVSAKNFKFTSDAERLLQMGVRQD